MGDSPKDVEGECGAWLFIADDHGDNHATMRCKLPKEHRGPHREVYMNDDHPVMITWETDDSYLCPKHGRVAFEMDDDFPCGKCYRELPDCPKCEGQGFLEKDGDYIDCTNCDGNGKLRDG